MTWEREWALLLAVLPLAWIAWQWRRTERKAGLLLKGLAAVAVALALAQPVMSVWETKMAVAVLVDTSASVSEADLERGSELASRIERARGRHVVRVMPFAADVRPPRAEERGPDWKLRATTGEEGRASNLETAILDATAAMPAGLIPRIVLVSDGFSSDLRSPNDEQIAKKLRDDNIIVYAVHIADSEIPAPIVNVTAMTGGEVFNPGDPEALKIVFKRIDDMQETRLEKTSAETMDDFFPYCVVGLSVLGLSLLTLVGLR